MRFYTLSAFLLSLLALLLTLAAGVTSQPVPACALGGEADLDHISGHASLISRRSQAMCHDADDEDDNDALDEEVDSPTSPSWQVSFAGHGSGRGLYDDDGDDDVADGKVALKTRSTQPHSKKKLERHGVHPKDLGEHMTKFDKVHHSHQFSHQSSHGTKTIKGSTVNKWAQAAVKNVGGRKKVLDHDKFASFKQEDRQRFKGYPKIGSGFGKGDAHDPVPQDHIAYHGILKPTRSERKGKGVPNPDPERQYHGPTRVIIHRHPNDQSWHVKTSYHDHAKPITGNSKNHPFSEMKAHHV